MKNFLLSLVCLFIAFPLFLNAQDASSYYKKAKKAFDKYQQNEEESKLEEALSNIKESIKQVPSANDKTATKVWLKAGEIYNEIAMGDYEMFLVNNNHKPSHPEAAGKAYEAYYNAVNSADKKWDKSNAFDELLKTATFISNEGIVAYNIENYEKAFQSFNQILEIKKFLTANEHTSILTKKSEYHTHLFRTGLAAHKSGQGIEAAKQFERLVEVKYSNPAIYSSLYQIYMDAGKEDRAITRVKDGRELFPEDDGLMIAEINHYLTKGKLTELTNKLETAIELNPENVSLYSTLGHVYNELQKAEAEKGNFTLAQNYFQQSMNYFSKALDVNGTYSPALYNIGALYYNKAAIITKEIKSIKDDKSTAGVRAIISKKNEMIKTLDLALPFFQRAEAVNPNDQATLGALKEIYSRKNDTAMISEFTMRLDKIQKGENISKGFFNQ